MPFASQLGIELRKAEPGEVIGSLAYSPRLCTAGGVLHGGALMTLADTLGAVCAYLNLPPGGRTATTTSATNFLRPVGAGSVTGTATPVHLGRSVIVVRIDVTDAHGKLAATTTQTQAVLPGPQERRT
ncbi:PaaI family thioesterase [Actinocrinis sp.]|uniref:PaaI family thioesterase n=1 Tax=Actinocrinis sp. TaxID=1920516 RepID=UPI0032C24476